jgi:hypothetical protein
MEHKEFLKFIEILKLEPFAIYPTITGPDQRIKWHLKRFTYVDDSPTHVMIQDTDTQKNYDLPLTLVEFANRGVLRLTRAVSPWNGSFV